MKAEELRIGNELVNGTVVSLPDGDIIINDGYQDWKQSKMVDRFEPIPLTEDWLLKFGWYKHELIEGSFRKEGKPYDQFQISWRKGILNYYISWHQLVPLKHVHQLQNLYFALTGEELEIK